MACLLVSWLSAHVSEDAPAWDGRLHGGSPAAQRAPQGRPAGTPCEATRRTLPQRLYKSSITSPNQLWRLLRFSFSVGVIKPFSGVHGSSVRTTLRGWA